MGDNTIIMMIGITLVILIGIFVVVYTRKNISQANISKSEEESKRIIEDAKKDAESKKKRVNSWSQGRSS